MASSLFEHPTLVVEQQRKLFEMRNQYRIFDQSGNQIGSVEQVNQSPLAFLARLASDLDVALPMTLELRDASGQPALTMHKPWFQRTFTVSRPDGTTLGSISKRLRLGKARFTVNGPSGEELGEVQARNWRARDFVVTDQHGTELVHTTKKWRGLATEMFTDADTYVVNVGSGAADPLRTLGLAATLAIDVVMKQQD